MGYWSAFIFAKLLLYAGGYIHFDVWLNLGFALLVALPTANARQTLSRNLLAVPLAVLLLYHDSYLPPLARMLAESGNLAGFSGEYLWELAGRLVNWKLIGSAVALLAGYSLARRKLRMSTFAFLGIFAVAITQALPALERHGSSAIDPAAAALTAGQPPPDAAASPDADPRDWSPEALDAWLAGFYRAESAREVHFQPLAAADPPYDIILVHVCSLAWDDLRLVGMDADTLLGRFNFLFTRFNSAASYSGPAAIRLLRGACGQSPHQRLYDSPDTRCLLVDGLQHAGFEPHWLMNHDGHFGDFFADVRDRGGMPAPLDNPAGAVIAQHAFDGSEIYDDYSVLSRWWSARRQRPAAHVVLYYNTISLHDGNLVDGRPVMTMVPSYSYRAHKLFSDLSRFMDDLQRSGAHAIVVLVPEHGAALRGDRRQLPGLREIPTPAISAIPVGVALINAPQGASAIAPQSVPGSGAQRRIDAPTSYLALSELLARLVANDPFADTHADLASYTANLPQTDAVAENDGTVVVHIGTHDMLRNPDGAWSVWD